MNPSAMCACAKGKRAKAASAVTNSTENEDGEAQEHTEEGSTLSHETHSAQDGGKGHGGRV